MIPKIHEIDNWDGRRGWPYGMAVCPRCKPHHPEIVAGAPFYIDVPGYAQACISMEVCGGMWVT